jgi:hypothetical protein
MLFSKPGRAFFRLRTSTRKAMKSAPFVAFVSAIFLFSCDGSEPEPSPIEPAPELKALRMIEPGGARELVYDNNGRLSELIMINQSSSGQEWRSTTQYFYDASGRLKESTTDTGWRLVYSYAGDLITATDEYVMGVLSQQHHYTYDDEGRLVSKVATQNIPEEGGIIPVSREEFEYDDRGNVTVQELYYYTSFGAESRLLTRFVYSNYDDKISSDEYFDLIAFNPILHLRKNNPGRMEVTSASGSTITEVYTYEYHRRGYATRKTTQTTMNNANIGEYVIEYEFE